MYMIVSVRYGLFRHSKDEVRRSVCVEASSTEHCHQLLQSSAGRGSRTPSVASKNSSLRAGIFLTITFLGIGGFLPDLHQP